MILFSGKQLIHLACGTAAVVNDHTAAVLIRKLCHMLRILLPQIRIPTLLKERKVILLRNQIYALLSDVLLSEQGLVVRHGLRQEHALAG